MRETRKSNNPSQQQLLIDVRKKKVDVLQQVVEHEYTKLFRQTHQTEQKAARHILRHVVQLPPPRSLLISIPTSTIESTTTNDDNIQTVSVVVSDSTNQKAQKYSTIASLMPIVSSIRELISYVPTMKNIATRGHLTGIPYLGDKFDYEDQQLIDSISGESTKQNKLIRKKKLSEQCLETLYQTIRSDQTCSTYSNNQIIDAILSYHRDSTPQERLVTFANQNDLSTKHNNRHLENMDTSDTIDVNIDELVIKLWCSRFCTRCYTYNCLLHEEKAAHLPLPEQFSVSCNKESSPCGSTCYKHEREHRKRSLSPSPTNEQQRTFLPTSSESIENVTKRRRKSTPYRRAQASDKLSLSRNENLHTELCIDPQKKLTPILLTRIENHMINQFLTLTNSSSQEQQQQQQQIILPNNWTLTDRSLFRLFYFVLDGDLCLMNQLFSDHRTCQDIYQQFILDAKYFSDHTSLTNDLPFLIRQSYRRRMLDGATRAFLLHIKKHNNNPKSTTLKPAYQPCLHDGPCTLSNPNCYCMQTGTFCEKYCNCSVDCPHRFPGCACKGACLLNHCLCCAEGRECDPDLCHKCGASLFLNPTEEVNPMIKVEPELSMSVIERKTLPSLSRRYTRTKINENLPTRQHSLRSCRIVEPSYKIARNQAKRSNSNTSQAFPTITCANISLQRKFYKQILIAESDVAGYGAFLGSPIAYPGDLIGEYTGEIISEEEADRRGRLYDKQACSYLFNLDTKRCVDARQFGNKIRFANHSSKPNCVPKIKLVNGDYRIGIYAKQIIFQGDELFFEYMYDAHHRQQFVNNERIDETEQDALTILKRFGDNFMLVRPSI